MKLTQFYQNLDVFFRVFELKNKFRHLTTKDKSKQKIV